MTRLTKVLFAFGVSLALILTLVEAVFRLSALRRTPPVSQNAPVAPTNGTQLRFSPADAHFRNLLAQTAGPEATRCAVIVEATTNPPRDREVFPLAAVPDGYDVYFNNRAGFDAFRSFNTSAAVTFQPIPKTIEMGTLFPAQMVRYGGKWYARAWCSDSQLQFAAKSKDPTLQITLSARDKHEVAIPAEQIILQTDGRGLYGSLPPHFQPEPRLVEATKIPGPFRTRVPTPASPDSPSSDAIEASEFVSSGFTASSNLVPLENIAEGRPFRVSSAALSSLQNENPGWPNSVPNTGRRVDLRPEIKGDWTLVRYGKKLYLRGWIAGPVRDEELRGKNLMVGMSPNDPQMGYRPTKITLPLSGLSSTLSSGETTQANFGKVSLDEHAWEKW